MSIFKKFKKGGKKAVKSKWFRRFAGGVVGTLTLNPAIGAATTAGLKGAAKSIGKSKVRGAVDSALDAFSDTLGIGTEVTAESSQNEQPNKNDDLLKKASIGIGALSLIFTVYKLFKK